MEGIHALLAGNASNIWCAGLEPWWGHGFNMLQQFAHQSCSWSLLESVPFPLMFRKFTILISWPLWCFSEFDFCMFFYVFLIVLLPLLRCQTFILLNLRSARVLNSTIIFSRPIGKTHARPMHVDPACEICQCQKVVYRESGQVLLVSFANVRFLSVNLQEIRCGQPSS